jgi:hypothetical protein
VGRYRHTDACEAFRFLQALLWPAYEAIIYPGLIVSFVAEVGLGLRLLVKGVRVVDPREQQATAEVAIGPPPA